MPPEPTGNGANIGQGEKQNLVSVRGENGGFSAFRLPDLKERLDVAAHLGAGIVVVLYVCGFLVVTLQDASRGIVGFGLFRSKVLAAGVLLGVFVALPLMVWSWFFGRSSLRRVREKQVMQTAVVPQGRARFYFGATTLLSFFWVSLAMAGLLCFFLLHCVLPDRFWICFWGYGLASAAVSASFDLKLLTKHPFACATVSTLVLSIGVSGLIWFGEQDFELMLFWFVITIAVAYSLRKEFRESNHWSQVNWHWLLLYVVGAIGFFAIFLYPQVEPALGGGKPTRAVFQFASPSPIDGQTKDNLWLLDEEDTGYYVLRTPEEHKAVFVPRSLVSAIYFGTDSDKPIKTEIPQKAETPKR